MSASRSVYVHSVPSGLYLALVVIAAQMCSTHDVRITNPPPVECRCVCGDKGKP